MSVTLYGKLQKLGNQWKWTGNWAFGTKLPNDPKLMQPFEYIWERKVQPSDVLVPSVQQPSPPSVENDMEKESKSSDDGDAAAKKEIDDFDKKGDNDDSTNNTKTSDNKRKEQKNEDRSQHNNDVSEDGEKKFIDNDDDAKKQKKEADIGGNSKMEKDHLKECQNKESSIEQEKKEKEKEGKIKELVESKTEINSSTSILSKSDDGKSSEMDTNTDVRQPQSTTNTTTASINPTNETNSTKKSLPLPIDSNNKISSNSDNNKNSDSNIISSKNDEQSIKNENSDNMNSNKSSPTETEKTGISFATPMNAGDPPFEDANSTYPDKCPAGGEWKGYFQNLAATKLKRASTTTAATRVPESFFLFLNAALPNMARTTFEDEKEARMLPIGGQYIHVRGMGTNQYGTFEIIGSYNLDKCILECQRMYVTLGADSVSTSTTTKNRASSARSSTQKRASYTRGVRTRDSNKGAPYFTRKKQNSWRSRKSASFDDGNTSGLAPSSATGYRRNSPSGVGVGKKRGRTSMENSSALNSASSPSSSNGVGVSISIPSNSSASGNKRPSPSSHASEANVGSTSRKRVSLNKGANSSGGSSNATNTAAMASSNSANHSASTLAQLRLPQVSDPKLAHWRAAHFLYYQRSEPSNEEEDGKNNDSNTKNKTDRGGNDSNDNNNTGSTVRYVVYEGELLNSQREGRGVCLFNNGMLYEGEWKRNKEHGYGKLMTADRKRTIYEGEWERGRMHGKGTYYYSSASENMKLAKEQNNSNGVGRNVNRLPTSDNRGRKNSKKNNDDGSTCNNNNDSDDKRGNRVKKVLDIESRYEGDFKENLRHGFGKYVLPDGSVYSGMWRDGMMSGRGALTWPDGSTYDGEWKDGRRHGQGLLRTTDGFTYDGMWIYNSMEGRGSAVYPNGQKYNGLFCNGRREGRGTLLFTNGAVYEGRFRDDAIDGQGTMKMPRIMVTPRSNNSNVADYSNGKKELEDYMIPVSFQSDMGHIHQKAGFTMGGE